MTDIFGQGITTSTVVAALFAMVLLYFLLRALAGPAKHVWRVLVMSVMGIVLIIGVNVLGRFVDISVPLNPFTVLLAGYLGVPGAAALIVIQILLR